MDLKLTIIKNKSVSII